MPAIDVPFAQAIDTFRTADGLVIDLRGNPGGLGGDDGRTRRSLHDRPQLLGKTQTRQSELVFNVNPRLSMPDGRRVQPFAGPVAILVDELIGERDRVLRGRPAEPGARARVRPPDDRAGAARHRRGGCRTGDVLMYALGDFVTSTGRRLEGDGVVPDEVVPLSIAGARGRAGTLRSRRR